MSGLVEEIRARRGDPDDPFDQAAARRDYVRGMRKADRARARELDDVYRQGNREGRDSARRRRSSPAAKTARRTVRRARRQTVRPVVAPLAAQAGQGFRFLGLSLATVVLYVVLQNAGYVEGFLGGLSKGLRWLADPNASIRYRESSS